VPDRGYASARAGSHTALTPAQQRQVVRRILERYPRTYAQEVGIGSLDSPSGLFQLLVMATLMSARIRSSTALTATKALFAHRWTSARAMASSTWAQRTEVLNHAGYARYDESTSRMLGETASMLLERYRGDLRRLREEAAHDPAAERRLLKCCKGIGEVGVDIFFREVQCAWSEIYPFADRRALGAAQTLGLAADADSLSRLARGADFVRLVVGLVHLDLEGSYDEVAI